MTCENADRRPTSSRSAFVVSGLVVSVLVSIGHLAQSPQGNCALSAHADQTGSDASGVIFRMLALGEVPRASAQSDAASTVARKVRHCRRSGVPLTASVCTPLLTMRSQNTNHAGSLGRRRPTTGGRWTIRSRHGVWPHYSTGVRVAPQISRGAATTD